MDAAGTYATRATARLPGLDIEIGHRRAVEGDTEQISINLRAGAIVRGLWLCARSRQPVRVLGAGRAARLAAVARGRVGPGAAVDARAAATERRRRLAFRAGARLGVRRAPALSALSGLVRITT